MPNLFDPEDFIDPNKNYLEELVGEGKKFRSPEDLARGKAEADAFVNRLQKELADQRELLKEQVNMNTILKALKDTQATTSNTGNQPSANEPPAQVSTLKPEDVESLLERKLSQRESQRRLEDNINFVEQKLIEAFGSGYKTEFNKRVKDSGYEPAFLENLAQTNPKALVKLLDIQPAKEPTKVPGLFGGPTPSTVNQTTNGGAVVKNYKYYQNLRKNDPLLYSKPSIQNEMLKQAEAMGAEDFYA
jgi:hypothetical protein